MDQYKRLRTKLMDPHQDDFSGLISLRMYDYQLEIIDKIVLHARTKEGDIKFNSRSHFFRSAILQTILKELHELDIKPRRPRQ